MRTPAVCALTLALLASVPVRAANVSLCAQDTQAGAGTNLAAAMTEGGRITFNCPPGTVIKMTRGHDVPAGTVIDGDGNITLDAQGAVLTMFKSLSGSMGLERIAIRGARARYGKKPRIPSPSVVLALGDLTLTKVDVSASEEPIHASRAVITDSTFSNNSGWRTVETSGRSEVRRSTFSGNSSFSALALRAGLVQGTTFSGNTGIALDLRPPDGQVSVTGSTFDRNGPGGAIRLTQRASFGGGSISIRRNVFRGNTSAADGGAITVTNALKDAHLRPLATQRALAKLTPARFDISTNQFIENRAKRGGAIQADLANTDGMTLRGNIFVRNVAEDSGGAVAWSGKSLTSSHNLFKANAADSGSALHARNPEPNAAWTIANSLVVENVARGSGAAVDVSRASVLNATIANNTGTGIAASGPEAARMRIANSIIAINSAGNCSGLGAGALSGANLQFGRADCPNVRAEDPLLDSLYVPALGSSALQLGDLAICSAAPVSGKDLLLQPRGSGGKCALGAYEKPPFERAMAALEARKQRGACPFGTVGPFPDCKTMPPDLAAKPIEKETCPPGHKDPKCHTVTPHPYGGGGGKLCQPGQVGVWPNCRRIAIRGGCGRGLIGVPPYCFPVEGAEERVRDLIPEPYRSRVPTLNDLQ